MDIAYFETTRILVIAGFALDIAGFETTTTHTAIFKDVFWGGVANLLDSLSKRYAGIHFLGHAIFVVLKLWIWQNSLKDSQNKNIFCEINNFKFF